MSNAQHAFDLVCGQGIMNAKAMSDGHLSVDITTTPVANMRDSSLIQVFTPPANHFVIYGGQMVMAPAGGQMIFPAMIIWEVRIGGRNFTNPTPLFTRNTVLLSQTDLRSGLLFAMQGPLFRQVILSARLVAIEPMAVQGGRVTMTLDPSVGMTGGAADLRVRVGDLVG